jgi:hypothetical protein
MTRKPIVLLILLVSVLSTAAAAIHVPMLFIISNRCLACHNGLVTPKGEEVSIGVDWRSSMMANSARDPYWQAGIRRETLIHPMVKAAIENECAACHMPMTRYQAKAEGRMGKVFAHLPIIPQKTPEDALAADGVSCTLCHQIRKDKLGERESFVAGFVIDTKTPPGSRRIFGPYEVDEGRQLVMKSSSGFRPEKGEQIQSSELCATCHTLFTHAFNEKGEVVGELPEQVPYLEWKHSAYYREQNCQSCHMPKVEGKMPISSTLGKPREDFGRHAFRGANFFIPKVLNLHGDVLGVIAEPLELATASARATNHLETSAAEVSIPEARIEGNILRAEVSVSNLAGHKLPSAYPSRRAWIHFTVLDAQGRVVFESGRPNPDGSIAGNDNDADRSHFEPHYKEIRSPEEVQIYESILGTRGNEVTTVLLAATQYLKDNRILPVGFDKASADGDIRVKGGAAEDADFEGGSDRVRYIFPVDESAGPFTVRAEFWYQPISYRWAHNVSDHPSAEAERFLSYFEAFSTSSGVLLARAEATAR